MLLVLATPILPLMNESKTKIYCFDSSVFIAINRVNTYFPIPDVWEEVDKLFQTGRLISHIYVYNEFHPDCQKPDFLGKWIKSRKRYFIQETEKQIYFVRQLLEKYERFIDPGKEKNEADPWVIALVMEKNEENSLFRQSKEYIVVSRENTRSAIKIPAVCKTFSVPHLTWEEFLADNNWRLRFIKD